MLIKPTLKTISELSGLAITTVSRALSNAPDISISTKEKVKKIADEIGYIPDRAGVRLRTGRTNVISLIMSTDSEIMDMTGRLISSIALGLRGTPYH
jgi:LacI family transcriptional regulator